MRARLADILITDEQAAVASWDDRALEISAAVFVDCPLFERWGDRHRCLKETVSPVRLPPCPAPIGRAPDQRIHPTPTRRTHALQLHGKCVSYGMNIARIRWIASLWKSCMVTRRNLLAAAALAAPALVARTSIGQTLRKVKLGTAFTTTTNAMFLMPDLLKPEGIDAEIITFPSLVQRMQAVASGSVDVGNGGLSATMQIATKGFPMAVLADGCDGGWMLVAKPSITSFAELAGKKCAVQNGSIGLVSLNWKLQHEGLTDKVELLFLDNQDMPVPLARGDVDAICCFEPYATFAELNGFGRKLWVPYDTPMGKTNLGFVASIPFIKKEPALTKVLVQAHVKATNTMRDNPKIAIETTVKQFNMSQEVAEASAKNLFFSADSGAGFQDGLKALAGMMLANKMLDSEPKWDEFINTSFI
jgi:NitT/TauT family transport system substrate-binding protein